MSYLLDHYVIKLRQLLRREDEEAGVGLSKLGWPPYGGLC